LITSRSKVEMNARGSAFVLHLLARRSVDTLRADGELRALSSMARKKYSQLHIAT